ncbi:MAG: hypothetical protein ABWY11_11375 [Umezawaea sp.]
MHSENRWHVVPTSARNCWIFLVLGLVLVVSTSWRIADAGELAVLPLISLVLAVALVGLAIAGLVAPKLRGR